MGARVSALVRAVCVRGRRARLKRAASRNRVLYAGMPTTLDSFDLRILERYQQDTRVPARAIGAAIGLSTAAVQRRLQRLREIGVIQREVAELAPKALGLPVTCLVGVNLERERAADIERFKRKMSALPEVQQCYYVTGQIDFFLVVLAAHMESYEAFTRRALLDDQNVASFTTYVVLERVKTGVGVPLPLP